MNNSEYFFNILGIKETSCFREIKSAYKKKVKQYHPDLSIDDDNKILNHLKMIQVNRAFFYLKKKLKKEPEPEKPLEVNPAHFTEPYKTGMLTKYKDPGYAYYKQGFNLYTKIHPHSWHLPLKKEKFFSTIKRKETNEEVIKIVQGLLDILPKSYYFFSRVLEEYPESSWAYDAREKMIRIEKLTPIYVRIVRSLKSEMRVME